MKIFICGFFCSPLFLKLNKISNNNFFCQSSFKKTRETITPIVDTKKFCVSKFSIEMSQRQHKKSSRSRKSGFTNSGNLIEMLKHRVEGGDKNLEKEKENCDINYL